MLLVFLVILCVCVSAGFVVSICFRAYLFCSHSHLDIPFTNTHSVMCDNLFCCCHWSFSIHSMVYHRLFSLFRFQNTSSSTPSRNQFGESKIRYIQQQQQQTSFVSDRDPCVCVCVCVSVQKTSFPYKKSIRKMIKRVRRRQIE